MNEKQKEIILEKIAELEELLKGYKEQIELRLSAADELKKDVERIEEEIKELKDGLE